jgi:hypothetical protein
MSIGIVRRIGDYGITINRCYILLLNLWFYGIYAYLFITKSRHIKWIIISPVIIVLISSFGFWSAASVTKHSLTKELNYYLGENKINIETSKPFFAEMDSTQRARIKSNFEYLAETYGKEKIQTFFADSISSYNIHTIISKLGLNDKKSGKESKYFSCYASEENKVWNTGNYNAFVRIKYYNHSGKGKEIVYNSEKDIFTIKIVDENKIFSFPVKEMVLKHLNTNSTKNDKKELTYEGENYFIVIEDFYGHYYEAKDSIALSRLDGYLFYNR